MNASNENIHELSPPAMRPLRPTGLLIDEPCSKKMNVVTLQAVAGVGGRAKAATFFTTLRAVPSPSAPAMVVRRPDSFDMRTRCDVRMLRSDPGNQPILCYCFNSC
jgi:hypothetical protein